MQALAHFFPGIDVWVSLTPGTYFVADGDADDGAAKPGRYVLSNRAYETDGTAVLARGQARQVTITG